MTTIFDNEYTTISKQRVTKDRQGMKIVKTWFKCENIDRSRA